MRKGAEEKMQNLEKMKEKRIYQILKDN